MVFRLPACWMIVLMMGLVARAEEGRYSAQLADGNRLSGDDLKNWHDDKQPPTLNNHRLFDDKNPVRWLIDHSLSPAAELDAFVEFFGGDRLPGTVVGFRGGTESAYHTRSKHLVVNPTIPLDSPRWEGHSSVRVSTAWLKRVVWQRRALDRYQPATVFLKDGRQIAFRSLRWAKESITLLLEEGLEEFPFDDLMEIHLPQPDPWAAYFAQLAVLSPQTLLAPERQARLLQLETIDGLKATLSTDRLTATSHGDRNKSVNWFHQCQPAWSLDPLWVRFAGVRTRRFFWPHQVPLTLIEPKSVRQNSPLGNSWHWQLDQSVHRQPLKSGGVESGWGFGVHAFHELAFDLPAAARRFRTRGGLDQSVGDGGSVRWTVTLRLPEEKGKVLYQSPVVIGSEKVLDTGSLALAAGKDPQAARQLVLTVDPLLSGTPAGADPLDVRDSLNWLEPEIELDREELRREMARHALPQIPALAGWTLEAADAEELVLNNHWDETSRDDPRYRMLLGSRAAFLSLSKRMSIGPEDEWLVLAVRRPHDKTPPMRVQVRIDGTARAELDVPSTRDEKGPDPLLIPVESFRGRTVLVEVVQFPSPEVPAPKTLEEREALCLDWRGLTTAAHRPGLLPLIAATPEFIEQLVQGEGTAALDEADPFSGSASLKVTPPERGNAQFADLRAAIRAQPRLGEYRYLSFAWKKDGGQNVALAVAHQGQLGADDFNNRRLGILGDEPLSGQALRSRRPLEQAGRGLEFGYRYLKGRGQKELGPSLKLDSKLPPKWERVDRDLFGDFGEFTLTGLLFQAFDGQAAWFDEIHLARDQRDFEFLPSRKKPEEPSSDPNLLLLETLPERFGLVSQSVAPRFAISQAAEGVRLLKERQGRVNVLRTHPKDQKTPCTLRAALVLPADQSSRLEMEVSRHPEADWQLIVLANGEKLQETLINKDNTPEGWLNVSVDLSKYNGQKVLLEIQNASNDWNHEEAYWSKVAVVSETKKSQ